MMNMQDLMKMNPYMSMFESFNPAKTFEDFYKNMQNMYSQKDAMNYFNQMMEMQNSARENFMKMMQSFNPTNACGQNVALKDMMENMMKSVNKMSQDAEDLSKNAQGIAAKKMEMMQEQVSEFIALMKKISSSNKLEEAIAINAEFLKDSFNKMLNNFHELNMMMNKLNAKASEKVNNMTNEAMQNMQKNMFNEVNAKPAKAAK